MKRLFIASGLAAILAVSACNKNSDSAAGGASTNYSFGGTLASTTTSGFKTLAGGSRPLVAKTITHVMAINPQVSSPTRFVSTVGSDGSFSLPVVSGKPYVLVFIAKGGGLTGPDMIAGIFRIAANDLESLAPDSAGGSAALGTVTVDGTAQTATITTTTTDLYAALGIDSATADYLGTIDDLSLRGANPDVDGNGEIDELEGSKFWLDFHIRGTLKLSGTEAKFSDCANTFLPATTATTITLGLKSAYAVYPNSYASTSCAANSGVDTTLASGCGFEIYNGTSDDSGAWPKDSYSGAPYSDYNQWGPDYNTGKELPGSSGSGRILKYTVAAGKTLTFSNVITKTIAQFTDAGTLIPFLKFNTAGSVASAAIESVEYKWRKLVSGGTWADATAEEVALVVGPNGGYITLYTEKTASVQKGVSFSIPSTAASGTITWSSGNVTDSSGTDLATKTLASFCSSAISYDDKLGLRNFVGSLAPNTGVTACP